MNTFSFAGNYAADQGATFYRRLAFKTDAGAALNVTGRTYAMQVRTSAAATETILDFKESDQTIVVTHASGYVDLKQSATVMAGIAAGEYVYDLEETVTATGFVTRVMGGKFVVSAEVTK